MSGGIHDYGYYVTIRHSPGPVLALYQWGLNLLEGLTKCPFDLLWLAVYLHGTRANLELRKSGGPRGKLKEKAGARSARENFA